MKDRAHTVKKFPPRNKDGNRQCRECGKEKPPKSNWLSWCSDECLEAYKIRAWPAHARKRASERDMGLCAICGLDTEKIRRWLTGLPSSYYMGAGPVRYGREDRFSKANGRQGAMLGRHRARAATLLGRLWGVKLNQHSHLYEIDHVVPVAEGGGGCGLDDLRTLCRRCHRIETAALNNRLRSRPTKGIGRGFSVEGQ